MRRMAHAHGRHRDAAKAYAESAAEVPESVWAADRGDGKWSPAAITVHLIKSFDALRQELAGGGAMKMRLFGWKLFYTRWRYLRRIVADGEFPTGAPAPRETRPTGALPSRDQAVFLFQAAADAFERDLLAASETKPRATLTHPYFGAVPLAEALFVSAKHIEHHHRQLKSRTS